MTEDEYLMERTFISLRLYFKDQTKDGYGTLDIRVPARNISWQFDEAKKPYITLDDIYQVKLSVDVEGGINMPGEKGEPDTWDRDGRD